MTWRNLWTYPKLFASQQTLNSRLNLFPNQPRARRYFWISDDTTSHRNKEKSKKSNRTSTATIYPRKEVHWTMLVEFWALKMTTRIRPLTSNLKLYLKIFWQLPINNVIANMLSTESEITLRTHHPNQTPVCRQKQTRKTRTRKLFFLFVKKCSVMDLNSHMKILAAIEASTYGCQLHFCWETLLILFRWIYFVTNGLVGNIFLIFKILQTCCWWL